MEETIQKKLLIVDDDAVVLRTMKDGLSGKYKIFGANSGANALKVLEKVKADLVLLDYEMPEMSGTEVLQAIRENPVTAKTPVMFLTGLQDKALQIRDLNVAEILQKSAPLSDIAERIDEFFRRA